MQRSYRLIITALVSVLVLYKLFTYSSSSYGASDSSWSNAHPVSEKDVHKEVIAGGEKVSDKVSEHKVAENALDALPGSLKSSLGGSSSSALTKNALANAT